MKILPGPSSIELGRSIASKLNLSVLEVDFKNFYDGETYLRIKGSVKNEEIIIVQSTNPHQEKHLVELLLLTSTLKEMGAVKIIAVVPYLCYSRADRKKLEGEVVSHRIILDLISKSGIDSLITVNVHNNEVYQQLNPELEKFNLSVIPLVVDYFKEMDNKDWFVIGPDEGVKGNVENVAKGLNATYAFMKKHRDPYTHQIELKDTGFECKGKDVLLIDDIVTSGGTALEASKIIMSKQPSSLTFFSIHAISQYDVFEKMLKLGVQEIISTNTIPRSDISQINISSFLSKLIEEKFL